MEVLAATFTRIGRTGTSGFACGPTGVRWDSDPKVAGAFEFAIDSVASTEGLFGCHEGFMRRCQGLVKKKKKPGPESNPAVKMFASGIAAVHP